MQARFCAPTEWYCKIHEVRKLRRPLIRLSRAHGPTKNSTSMLHAQMFSNKLMLRSYVVVKQHFWKWAEIWHI